MLFIISIVVYIKYSCLSKSIISKRKKLQCCAWSLIEDNLRQIHVITYICYSELAFSFYGPMCPVSMTFLDKIIGHWRIFITNHNPVPPLFACIKTRYNHLQSKTKPSSVALEIVSFERGLLPRSPSERVIKFMLIEKKTRSFYKRLG